MGEAAPSLCSALVKFSKLLSAYEVSEGRAWTVATTLHVSDERSLMMVPYLQELVPWSMFTDDVNKVKLCSKRFRFRSFFEVLVNENFFKSDILELLMYAMYYIYTVLLYILMDTSVTIGQDSRQARNVKSLVCRAVVLTHLCCARQRK